MIHKALAVLAKLPDWERLSGPGFRFGLNRFRRFLSELGSPQRNIGSVILVAGTKGKGSTCVMLDAILRAAGYRTGLYLSPHLQDVRERIQVAGERISQADFVQLVEEIKPALRRHPVTWFEAMTAIALLYFVQQRADCAILEVGMGGRCDATNVTQPVVSVITRIGLDHTEVLGSTIAEIASEKAGIIRRSRPVVVATQPAAALSVIRTVARRRQARVIYVPARMRVSDISVSFQGTAFTLKRVRVPDSEPERFQLRLIGQHQVMNAVTAVLAAETMFGKQLRHNQLATGLRQAFLPGRCQIIRRKPFLMVDGAHNPDSVAALVQTLHDLGVDRVIGVLGLLRDKPAEAILKLLMPVLCRLVIVEPASPRARPAMEIQEIAHRLGIPATVAGSLRNALRQREGPTLVTGSLYLAGEALRILV